MSYAWDDCPQELKDFVFGSMNGIADIMEEQPVGVYLHGSLAMGGFNPNRSDIDLIVVTEQPLSMQKKQKLAHFFLEKSSKPFPIEISSLTLEQLESWSHPTPYDFHFSEFWRERYETELLKYINDEEKTDGDLAAHFMILQHRGMCLAGRPIEEIFPSIPHQDYLASIMEDYEECVEKIIENPVYCTLNLIRVYWYVKEGNISSKQEAGVWGQKTLPNEFSELVQRVAKAYASNRAEAAFVKEDLIAVRDYLRAEVEKLMTK
ncbi:MAG: aminoglycoside adenylyltransferase domain-containing protein [Bacillota bacterium]